MKQIQKILFDLDGTLFNTQQIHAEVESSLLIQKGILLTPDEITRRYAGTPTVRAFTELLGSADDAVALLAQKRSLMLGRMGDIRPLYTESFFKDLRDRGYRLSIGTGSQHRTADPILERFNIAQYFDQIVCVDDVTEGKPHPETWERAAAGVAPESCLVVEDGLAGSEAAFRAGMRVALLPPCEHPSSIQITSLDDLLRIL